MNYHPDDFLALADEVEHEGGYVQPDTCSGEVFRLKIGSKWKRYTTVHCDMQARLAIPYDPSTPVHETLLEYSDPDDETPPVQVRVDHDGEPASGSNFAAVCAVDDAVGLWPRYKHLMTDESYQP